MTESVCSPFVLNSRSRQWPLTLFRSEPPLLFRSPNNFFRNLESGNESVNRRRKSTMQRDHPRRLSCPNTLLFFALPQPLDLFLDAFRFCPQ